MAPMWTRKKTVIAGKTLEDDWIVYRSGVQAGRVYATQIWDEALSWLWVVWGREPAQGYAPTLELALEEVRARLR